jgi:hypothetical protein
MEIKAYVFMITAAGNKRYWLNTRLVLKCITIFRNDVTSTNSKRGKEINLMILYRYH